MAKQYEVLKPFLLPFFRPVEIGELVTLDPDHIIEYQLQESAKEVEGAIADPPEIEK